MIEVFKTNVESNRAAGAIVHQLREHLPSGRINFDLQDCDKILRIENDTVSPQNVISILNALNYLCEVLP